MKSNERPEGWGESLVEPEYDAEFDTAARRLLGFRRTPDCLLRLLPAEWVAVSTIPLFMRHDAVAAPAELTDLAVYLTAEADGCRYTAGSAAARLRLLGRSRKELARLASLARGTASSGSDVDSGLAALARTVACAVGDTTADARSAMAQLEKSGLSTAAVRELAACCIQTCFYNSVCSLLSMPPFFEMERMPDNLFIKLARPIIARSLRGRTIDASTLAVPGKKRRDFPFPALLGALRGTWYEAWSFTAVERWRDWEGEGLSTGARFTVMERILRAMGALQSAGRAATLVGADPVAVPRAVEEFALRSISAGDGEWQKSARLVSYLPPAGLVDLVGTAALARFAALVELTLQRGAVDPG